MKLLDFFTIKITLTNECNFSCSYCSLFYKDKNRISLESLLKIIKKMKDITNYKEYKIIITGGEPTVYKYFRVFIDNLIDIFKDKKLLISLNSNLSNIENLQYISNKNTNLNLFLSYHAAFTSSQIFYDNFKKIYNKNTNYTIAIMIENTSNIFEDITFLKNKLNNYNNVQVTLSTIQNIKNYYNNFEFKHKINSSELFNYKSVNTKNLKCNCIINHIWITPKGEIFPGHNCPQNEKPLGFYNDPNTFKKIKKWVEVGYYVCPYSFCVNCSDIIIKEKWR